MFRENFSLFWTPKLTKMKHLLLALLLCPLLALSQEKKDNVIVVTLADSTKNFEQVINMLTAENYKFSHSPNSKKVTTKFSYIGKYNNPVYYTFRLEGNTVRIHGWYNWDHNNHPILYKWGGGEWAFKEMDRLAKLLGTTTYTKEDLPY